MCQSKVGYSSEKLFQEKMWIEIIQSMENLYAQLADNQVQLEEKNRELSATKEFMEGVLNDMAETLVVTDNQGRIKRVNRATLKLLGYRREEILGKSIGMILDTKKGGHQTPEYHLRYLLEEGKTHNIEMSYLTRGGESIPMSFSVSLMRDEEGARMGMIMVARDMRKTKELLQSTKRAARRDRRKAQELKKAYEKLQNLQTQLIHSEKLASVGRLAAGVAHEINNPLTGILTFTHLLLSEMSEDNPVRDELNVIAREAKRCKLITQNLLDFARQTEPEKVSTNINKLIKETLSIVENQAPFQNIRIVKSLNPSLPCLLIDPNQIQQVLMNVLLNAQEAMPRGGFLTISTDFTEDDNSLEIKFIDTGYGISEENLEKIFDPFFTTKEVGTGTGLGLAVSYGIIKSHGGQITIYSKKGRGTTVLIKLPLNKKGKKNDE